MKKALLFFAFIGLHWGSKADCSDWALSAWPSGNTIHANGIFMIEGYAFAQKIIDELNIKYPVYLVSGEEKIKLVVKETLKGQMGVTQAILSPEKPLTVDKDYTLHIGNIGDREQPKKYNAFIQTWQNYTWKVVKGEDKKAPMWDARPTEKDKSIVHFGCGPAAFVYFNCVLDESAGEVLVRTSVTDTKTLKTTTYYLQPQKGLISIGHGMCAGAFKFESDHYEVSFDLMDTSGNITYWQGGSIKFTPPVDEKFNSKKK